MDEEKYIDNKKDFSLYVASFQAEYDQVNAFHADTVKKLETEKKEALANGDVDTATELDEIIAKAAEMKNKANKHLENLYWVRENLFTENEGVV
jgi:hypothetical protein